MPEQHIVPSPWRRERWIVLVIVATLVVWRSGVLVFWEQAQFDSDQAVMGLMAKHLVEGRAFPVFMYGQSYILGVQAWLAAPMFVLFGVSVAALKLPLLLINLAIAILFVRILEHEVGLRPALAAAAAVPFVMPSPGTTAHLLEASGGNPEPFLYALLMWLTRRRPWVCGLILGFGFLQREFTIYALVALLCIWAVERTLFTREGLLRLGRVALSAAGVWVAVQGLGPVPPVGAKRTVIGLLDAAGVKYGTADYWMAYYVSFLTKERIVLHSSDFVRIRTYDWIVKEHPAESVRLSRRSCPGGRELIRNVYMCP